MRAIIVFRNNYYISIKQKEEILRTRLENKWNSKDFVKGQINISETSKTYML